MSNQVTLGASAAELTDKLVETATTIIDAEKKAREQVRSQNEPALRDRIYRAAGTMKSAYLIDTSEAVQCISDVLIGLQMGFLSGMDAQKLYALEEHIRPAMRPAHRRTAIRSARKFCVKRQSLFSSTNHLSRAGAQCAPTPTTMLKSGRTLCAPARTFYP